MKKNLAIIICMLMSAISFGQIMQSSIGAGTTPSAVKLYIKPDVAVNGNISTLQFDVAISTSVSPVPTLSIVGTPPIGSGWVIDPPFAEGGFRHYQILCPGGFNVNIGAGVETMVMELKFTGGPGGTFPVTSITLGDGGGMNGNALYLCTGVANSVEGQLYYARPGTVVVNNLSYSGPLNSTATVSGISLPVELINFSGICKKGSVELQWTTASEHENASFTIERSNDHQHWEKVGVVSGGSNSTAQLDYTYQDLLLRSGTLYYRLRYTDYSGEEGYSPVIVVEDCSKQSFQVEFYPNPSREIFHLKYLLDGDEFSSLEVFNELGELIISTKEQIAELDLSNYTPGVYFCRVNSLATTIYKTITLTK